MIAEMSLSPSLPEAGQPDIVLASQKDAYYRRELFEKVNKAVESMLGPHISVAIRPEIRLVSELAYFGLTSFRSGGQTPGEEFCDLLQVQVQGKETSTETEIENESTTDGVSRISNSEGEGGDKNKEENDRIDENGNKNKNETLSRITERVILFLPSTQQRVGLLIFSVIVPYLFKRVRMGGWNSLLSAFKPHLTARERAEAFRRRLQRQQQRRRQMEMGENPDADIIDHEEDIFKSYWKIVKPWLPKVATIVSLAVLLERLHLATFYVYGRYLSWAKRLAGIQYANTKEPETQRMSYKVLGVFLFIQIGLETYPNISAMLWTLMKTWGVIHDSPDKEGRKSQKEDSVVPYMVPITTRGENADTEDLLEFEQQGLVSKGPAHIKCGICLSEPIDNPAAPKCGHMFCYECILGSTLAKEECPVCRQNAKPKDIQCIYFALSRA
uniref:RING-type E3 ubiquitin transferase n=1 Tax=Aplanochytrium stocchinoi TaxID=215587 RepID=A0A7S3PCD9_9STRA|mmetsp:Transcript_11979/g.13937  ORF Transcript_11979/g.13937 Transcript_11979/m.13937 type:complete len:442 (-) Transcript_11979:1464-2789(-)